MAAAPWPRPPGPRGQEQALTSVPVVPWRWPASRFMAYHTPLRDSHDYTEALRATRALAANITADLRKVPGTDPAFEVFPYT